ncbi:MAG TPA: S41 family peptidase [Candidatus Baltobacteraceae bacterium]|nr:S41 family peptidase [Candidatus Baltobacteraceae bacterium]
MKRFFPLALAGCVAAAFFGFPAVNAAPAHLDATQASEIATSYHYLTGEFYKRIDDQNVMNGARIGIARSLARHHVTAKIPKFHASNDTANVQDIELDVEAAERAAGRRVSSTELTYGAISGMLDSVHDRYTVFLDPKEYAELNSGLDGSDFGGTGIVIQADDASKYIAVSDVVPGGPADKAGIQQDDLITAIDGQSTKGWSIDRASAHLRGKEGTKVSITILRAGKTLAPITVTRAKIHQLSVFDKMLPGNIGYVALTVFGKDTASELTSALGRLQKKGARAIILDLRNNGGGYLNAAVGVSSEFISSGPIVSVESRGSNITTLEANDTAIPPLPLAVLVNQFTASASEITSGAIQDSGVGTLIGTKTFGKGVVQTIYPLPDGSAVKITTARYLTPHNRDINHLGIQPDIVVSEPRTARFGDPKTDPQLRRAMQFVDDRIAHLNEINGSTE